MGLPGTSFDTGAQRKRLRTAPPKLSGEADPYTSWRRSFLSYAHFHAFIECRTGHANIYSSRIRSERWPISAGFTARSFEVSKIAQYALRTCGVDRVCRFVTALGTFTTSRIVWMRNTDRRFLHRA